MNLEDISNKHLKNLNSFFRDDKVIEYIYKEQFGEKNYNDNNYYIDGDAAVHNHYHDKFNEILDNTIFIPYITLDHLDNMLINAQRTFGRVYLDLYENLDKKEQLRQKIKSVKNDIMEKNSSLMIEELKQVFPNLTIEQYSTMLKHCSNTAAQSITDKYFIDNNGFFSKKKKLKAQEIIEKNIKMTDEKIIEEVNNINSEAELLYGLEANMKRFGEEIKLSKRLNAKKKDIIKKYSSFMLDELKQLFHGLTEDEYSKILKDCKNNNFDENAEFIIEENLFKDKKGFFANLQKNKAQQIVEKYRELTSKKILMETSTFYKHFSDVPNGKYYTDILEKMSRSNISFAVPCIGKQTNKNIRYIFLPILQYKDKENYIKTALHEVMHISKEQISKENYKTGMLVTDLPKDLNASIETASHRHFDLPNFMKRFNWMSRYEKKLKLAAQHKSTTEEQDLLSKYNTIEGISISEEMSHNWQAGEVLLKIVNDGLLEKVDFPYNNTSINGSLDYELFDNATKEFDSYFKEDIQEINRGDLSLKKFKRKVGVRNFDSFAKTAYLCTNDPECSNETSNLEYSKKDMYNDIGVEIVKKMVDKVGRRNRFLHKTKSLSPSKIVSTGKNIEMSYTNRQKYIDREIIKYIMNDSTR